MAVAAAAGNFGALHTIAVIGRINNAALCNGFKKAGPAAAAVKLSVAFKKRVTAYSAKIGAGIKRVPVLTGKSPFGTFFTGNIIYLFGQYFFPFFVAECYFTRIGF